jgi:hypothetical protein
MKITSIVSYLNQFEITAQIINFLLQSSDSDILVIDNGSNAKTFHSFKSKYKQKHN